MRKLGMLLLVLLFTVTGCAGVSISPNADGTFNISVSLSESDVNSLVANALAASPQPILRNTSVDLQNGQIVVRGIHDRQDGSGPVDGTMTLTAGVANGQVSASVTSLNIAGFNADAATLQQINGQIAAGLGASALSGNEGAQLTALSISDTALTFTLRVSPQ